MKMLRLIFPRIADLLARDDAGAGGAGAGDDKGGDGSGAGDGAGGQGGDGKGLLTGDKGDKGGAAGGAAGAFEIPEKFLVKGADGNPDYKAIVEKSLPAYLNLEKKLGAGEAPPESPDKYKIEKYLPDGYESQPEVEKAILTRLHKAGLSNKQVQETLTMFGEYVGQGLAQEKASMESATAELQKEWGDKFEQRLGRVNFTLAQAPKPIVEGITNDPKLMNDPKVIRLLDWIGEEFGEDSTLNLNSTEIEETEKLMTSEAYTNPNHADHKRTVEKVANAFARGYKPK